MDLFDFLTLIGGLCLFLFGMHLFQGFFTLLQLHFFLLQVV